MMAISNHHPRTGALFLELLHYRGREVKRIFQEGVGPEVIRIVDNALGMLAEADKAFSTVAKVIIISFMVLSTVIAAIAVGVATGSAFNAFVAGGITLGLWTFLAGIHKFLKK